MLQRQLLDRAGMQFHAAPGRAIGLGQYQRHLMAGSEDGLQRGCSELGSAGKCDFHWEGSGEGARHGGARGQAVMRAFLASRLLMRLILRRDRYSTNTLPSR